MRELARSNDPLAAAVRGVTVLEDDPRFNAGTGSMVRLDGSIQMDASVMDSSGRFGAVAGLERVKNPVLVARAVLDTPHLLLMGDGATRFARALGHADYDPATPQRRLATETIKEKIRRAAPDLPEFWRTSQWKKHWNYALSPEALRLDPRDAGTDTVGVAVRAPDGRFAVALSTGGTAVMLRGRVGDVPIYGAGLYAGPHGTAAATGTGERIMETMLGPQRPHLARQRRRRPGSSRSRGCPHRRQGPDRDHRRLRPGPRRGRLPSDGLGCTRCRGTVARSATPCGTLTAAR